MFAVVGGENLLTIIADFGIEGVLFTMLDMETNGRLLGHLQASNIYPSSMRNV